MPFKDKQKRKEYEKQYREKNREKLLEKYKRYYYKNKEAISERKKSAYNKDKSNKRRNLIRNENIEFLLSEGLLTDCVVCGFPKENFIAIDFHHINPKYKQFSISDLMKNRNKEILLNEVKKCVCLCRNCHALYHGNYPDVVKRLDKILSDCNGRGVNH